MRGMGGRRWPGATPNAMRLSGRSHRHRSEIQVDIHSRRGRDLRQSVEPDVGVRRLERADLLTRYAHALSQLRRGEVEILRGPPEGQSCSERW